MANGVPSFALPADDLARAEKFYRETFDWEITSIPGVPDTTSPRVEEGQPELRRRVRRLIPTEVDEEGFPIEPGYINGLLIERKEEISATYFIIEVDDLDKAMDRVAKSGGKIFLGRAAVGELGFTAYFTDTEGNVCCLWETSVPGVRIGAPTN